MKGGYLTQCRNFRFCGHSARLAKPGKWTCEECEQKEREITLKLEPSIPWPPVILP